MTAEDNPLRRIIVDSAPRGAIAATFEAIRLGAEAQADADPDLFATWMLVAGEAADGRDALIRGLPGQIVPPPAPRLTPDRLSPARPRRPGRPAC